MLLLVWTEVDCESIVVVVVDLWMFLLAGNFHVHVFIVSFLWFLLLILERMREKTGWCLCSKSCGYSEFSLTHLTAANDCLNSDRLGLWPIHTWTKMPLGWTARHKMHLDLGQKLNQNEIMTIIKNENDFRNKIQH